MRTIRLRADCLGKEPILTGAEANSLQFVLATGGPGYSKDTSRLRWVMLSILFRWVMLSILLRTCLTAVFSLRLVKTTSITRFPLEKETGKRLLAFASYGSAQITE